MSGIAWIFELNAPLGITLALACSVFWALANIYVQRAELAVGSLRAMFWAQTLGAVVLVPVALGIDGMPQAPAPTDLVITAISSGLGYYGLLKALGQGALAGVVPIITAWAVPAAIAGVVWSGENPGALDAFGGLLIVIGAVGNGVLASTSSAKTPLSAMLWATASALGFGVMAAGSARMRDDLGAVGVIPAIWLAQWVLMSPLLLVRREVLLPPKGAWAPVLGMALTEGAGFVCFTLASRLAPVAIISPPASLSAVLTVLWGATMLGEHLSWTRWAMVLLAAVGTIIIGVG